MLRIAYINDRLPDFKPTKRKELHFMYRSDVLKVYKKYADRLTKAGISEETYVELMKRELTK